MELTIITGAILSQFQTSAVMSALIGGIIGNRSDSLLINSTQKIYQMIKNSDGEPTNHDIQRAVRASYLKSTLVAANYVKSKYTVLDNLTKNRNPNDIVEIISYIKKELKLLDKQNVRFTNVSIEEHYLELLFPSGENAVYRLPEIIKELKDSVLLEFKKNKLRVELALDRALSDGWEEDSKHTDWFELTCAFFNEELKTNTRISTLIQTQYLDTINSEVSDLKLLVNNIKDKIEPFSNKYQPLLNRIDEILNISKDIKDIASKTENNTVEIKKTLIKIEGLLDPSNDSDTKLEQIETPKVIDISTFSNENLLSILSLFEKSIENKTLTKEELADAYDTKTKLQDTIFKPLDDQLETKYKDAFPSVIFDRIISFKKLQKTDFDSIQNIRNNKNYTHSHRSLIVSGITLSLYNNFDSVKLNLLVDFLTDFEDVIWQKALIGILLCHQRYDNRLGLYPEISIRLEELKQVDKVQQSLIILDRIFRYRKFSIKDTYAQNKSYFINMIQNFYGSIIRFDQEEMSFLKRMIDQELLHQEDDITLKMLNLEKTKEFYNKHKDEDTFETSFGEFFNCLDYDTYAQIHELNPFQFKMDSEIYQDASNWFIPFENTKDIKNILASSFHVSDIDIDDFINILKNSQMLSDIDKNYIIINIKSFSEDFISSLYFLMKHERELFNINVSNLELTLLAIVKDLYRFEKLAIIPNNLDIFKDNLSIYNKTLLDKIGDNITNIKIKAKYLYDDGQFVESLAILDTIKTEKKDTEILELLAHNNYHLENYEDTITHINGLLSKKWKNRDMDSKAFWIGRLRFSYFKIEDFDNYESCLKKEIFYKEKILVKTIEDEENNDTIKNKTADLSINYFNLSTNYWNYRKDVANSFKYFLKYIKSLVEIPFISNEELTNLFKPDIKSVYTFFDIFLSNKDNLNTIKKHLKSQKKKNSTSNFYTNIEHLIAQLNGLTDLKKNVKINLSDISEDANKNAEVMYESIIKVVINVFENQKEYKRIVVPFAIVEDITRDIVFTIEPFLNEGKDYFIKELSQDIYTDAVSNAILDTIDDYIINYFSDEKLKNITHDIIMHNVNIQLAKMRVSTNSNNTSNENSK